MAFDLGAERMQRVDVGRHAVFRVVPTHDAAERASLLRDGRMPATRRFEMRLLGFTRIRWRSGTPAGSNEVKRRASCLLVVGAGAIDVDRVHRNVAVRAPAEELPRRQGFWLGPAELALARSFAMPPEHTPACRIRRYPRIKLRAAPLARRGRSRGTGRWTDLGAIRIQRLQQRKPVPSMPSPII